MKKRLHMVAGFLLIGLVTLVALVAVWREDPICGTDFLTLHAQDMPIGWRIEWRILPPALDERMGALDAVRVFMQKDDMTAQHTVYQFPNRLSATFRMLWYPSESSFPSVGWAWSELDDSGVWPLESDRYHVKCGKPNLEHLDARCSAILQNGPIIAEFTSSIDAEGMSIQEFRETVLKVDGLLASCAR
jgi:hypothetical protein